MIKVGQAVKKKKKAPSPFLGISNHIKKNKFQRQK